MNKNNIPTVTRAQMMEVDRLMTEEYGITLLQMMENAGRDLAQLARDMVGADMQNKRIAVLCGGGNNGGGGMAAARHLANWGGRSAGLASCPAQYTERSRRSSTAYPAYDGCANIGRISGW